MCFGEKSLRGSKSGAIWSRTAWGSPGHPGFGQMLIFLVKTHEHNQFFIINRFGYKKITNTIDMAKTKVLDQIAPEPNSPGLPYCTCIWTCGEKMILFSCFGTLICHVSPVLGGFRALFYFVNMPCFLLKSSAESKKRNIIVS